MTDTEQQRAGRCLCGAVSYRVRGALRRVLHCHCENCRRLSGNFVAASRAHTVDLSIDDAGRAFRWHDLGYARYGFCTRCGSTLFYRAADRGDLTSIMVGTLDDASELDLAEVWFADEAQPHHTLPADVPRHPGNSPHPHR